MLTGYHKIPSDRLCYIGQPWPDRCQGKPYCDCTPILEVALGQIVELILVDEVAANHPFHLHGMAFMVIQQGKLDNMNLTKTRAEEIENTVGLPRSYSSYPPFKDTITIPSRGYAIVRFRAENPGLF